MPTQDFKALWTAYAVSTYGTWIAFGAFPLLAVRELHASAIAVSLLEAAGLAVAALVAFPLGPWIDHRAKRPVMVAMDLLRFVAMATVPIAYLFQALTYAQLLVVSIVSGTANIAFTAASGAYLKHLVHRDQLLAANGRFEGTSWTATALGPPLGGALVVVLGPVVTVAADACSYLLSALAVRRIRGTDLASPSSTAGRRGPTPTPTPTPTPSSGARLRAADFFSGWHLILDDPGLRRLYLNGITVSGLIMATTPLLAVLLLGEYQLSAWQYGLAFGLPSIGGFVGARLSARLVTRFGRHRVMIVTGWLRSIFPLGLAFTRPGVSGLVTVIVVEALLITCMGIFNPISATERLQRTPTDQAARVLTAWSVSSKLAQAGTMVIWGLLATITSPLTAITVSGVLLLGTPLLLPKRDQVQLATK
ncbi:MFS transporter [Kribbella sp. DT2]|uniref:MFS transporter n=1 Tax=Kribbella sp. DT2 TaxID=3393427 RepID=UPI003CF585B0